MLGFSIYVSNTTDKLDGKLCYKEQSPYTSEFALPSWVVTCNTHGQYVFYYNERLQGITYPDDYSKYAYNDICELEVWGKYFHAMVRLRVHWSFCMISYFFDFTFLLKYPFYDKMRLGRAMFVILTHTKYRIAYINIILDCVA